MSYRGIERSNLSYGMLHTFLKVSSHSLIFTLMFLKPRAVVVLRHLTQKTYDSFCIHTYTLSLKDNTRCSDSKQSAVTDDTPFTALYFDVVDKGACITVVVA